MHRAIQSGLIRACHDLSEGGLAVAAAEMAFAGGLGLSIDLDRVPNEIPIGASREKNIALLFSESNTRFLCEVPRDRQADFEKTLAGVAHQCLGEVNDSRRLQISCVGETLIDADLAS